MYLAAFSFMVRPWASAHFFISKVMATPVLTIMRSFNGLAFGLVTPRNLPGCNTEGDVQLISWLLLGYGQLRPWLGHLEPTCRYMYILGDQGALGSLSRAPSGLDYWGLRCMAVRWHDDRCSHHTQDVVLNLLSLRILWHFGQLSAHCALTPPYTPLPTLDHCPCKPFGQACHCQGELVPAWTLGTCTVCQLYLFRHALRPQYQNLPAYQPIIDHDYGWPPSTACCQRLPSS